MKIQVPKIQVKEEERGDTDGREEGMSATVAPGRNGIPIL
jgi:hypothetical protein